MSSHYASKQPAGFKNRVENVAIVGFTGTVGKHITSALLEGGKHKIVALTRVGGRTTAPAGVELRPVNYEDESTIVKALKGQDALIVTMGNTAPPEQQTKLINAAAAAGVPWVLPNEWGFALNGEGAGKDVFLGPKTEGYRKQITALGKSSWIGIACGFYYDLSLAVGAFGFNNADRTAVFVDDGNIKCDVSTLAQTARAVAKVLSLKVLPDDEHDKAPTISKFRDNFVYFHSFKLTQNEMFQSILRVTGTKPEDWKISHENHVERFTAGHKELQTGNASGFAKLLYTRFFYPDNAGDLELRAKLANDVLGLPKENLDEETKKAFEMPATYG